MLVISIIEAEDFGEELYPIMRDSITGLIKSQHVGLIVAAGDNRGMIYRLLCEIGNEYPHVFCTILLSNDKLAYEGGNEKYPNIFSLDCDIVHGDINNAKKRRLEKLVEHSDIVFCRQKYSGKIRKINKCCDILAL